MKWNDFLYKGKSYKCDHLHPFEWSYSPQKNINQKQVIYKFHILFSMHCFTRKPLAKENVSSNLWYIGPKEKRVFCFDRHKLSHHLPDIIKNIDNKICWHTHHGNYFTIEITDKDEEKIEYEVYFNVTRASRKGWLNLVIQSAYVRTKEYESNRPKKRKISFKVIASNTQLKRKIRPAR